MQVAELEGWLPTLVSYRDRAQVEAEVDMGRVSIPVSADVVSAVAAGTHRIVFSVVAKLVKK